MKAKLILVVLFSALMALGLAACAGGGSSSGGDENTLESYFAQHQDEYDSMMGGVEESLAATEGIEGSVDIKGNDVVVNLDITEMFKNAGIDKETAKASMETSAEQAVEGQMTTLKTAMDQIESATGISDTHFVYHYLYDGEDIFTVTVDKNGVVK